MPDTSQPPLPEPWRVVFDRLVAEAQAEPPVLDDGRWTVRFEWVGVSCGQVLSILPGSFARVAEHWEEMCDHTGECVDFESESGVWACEESVAVFDFTDHWQAGLGGAVTVYPDLGSYREGLAATLAHYNDTEDELSGPLEG